MSNIKSDTEKLQNLRTEIKSAGGQTLKEAASLSEVILALDSDDPTADSVAMMAALGAELADRVRALLQLMAAEKVACAALDLVGKTINAKATEN